MDENKTAATADSAEEEAIREDFNGPYSTRVHRIGRTTLCIALVLSFLPVFYMYFVKGWQVAGYYYVTVAATLFALCIGMWITEPLIYYPMLGAAAMTYVAALATAIANMLRLIAIRGNRR